MKTFKISITGSGTAGHIASRLYEIAAKVHNLVNSGEENIEMEFQDDILTASIIDENPQDKNKTKVVFLHEHETEQGIPGIYAYFPDMVHYGGLKTCYAHVGQHSACSPQYAKESRPATPEEYADLKAELESIGYNLEITTL